eukprot:Pgem_evm1s15906
MLGSSIAGIVPTTPLEVTSRSTTYLSINYNCTRPAKCLAKLGFCKESGPFTPLLLSSLSMSGGWIGCVDVVIQRVYPVLYMDRQEGRVTIYNDRTYDREQLRKSKDLAGYQQ